MKFNTELHNRFWDGFDVLSIDSNFVNNKRRKANHLLVIYYPMVLFKYT